MKYVAKFMEWIGITSFFIGGAGMDDIKLVPILMAFVGLAVAVAGWRLEAEYV
jgi:hypothetical protein